MKILPKSAAAALACLVLLGGMTLPAQADPMEEIRQGEAMVSLMRSYFGVVEDMHAVAADREKAAILKMQKIQEFYQNRGERARLVDVLEDVLKRTENPAIRSAAYMMLAETFNETGRTDRAIETLRKGLEEDL